MSVPKPGESCDKSKTPRKGEGQDDWCEGEIEREKSTNRPLVFGVIVGELVVKMVLRGFLSASHVVFLTS